MKDSFSRCHPVVNFIYFAATIVFSMIFLHPALLPMSLWVAIIYSIHLNGVRSIRFNIFAMLPAMLLTAILNPLLNHAGVTILFYTKGGNPITLEAAAYGAAAGCMLITVIIWFSCYNAVMTSDKFIYLFARMVPALSLVFSMTLRFIPKLKAQIKVISVAQQCVGKSATNGNILERISNGVTIISILTTWALENAIETAESMKARGYGLKGRTSFSVYRFDKRDKAVMCVMILCVSVVITGVSLGEVDIKFFPAIIAQPLTLPGMIVCAAYFIFLCIPIILNMAEGARWKYLKLNT